MNLLHRRNTTQKVPDNGGGTVHQSPKKQRSRRSFKKRVSSFFRHSFSSNAKSNKKKHLVHADDHSTFNQTHATSSSSTEERHQHHNEDNTTPPFSSSSSPHSFPLPRLLNIRTASTASSATDGYDHIATLAVMLIISQMFIVLCFIRPMCVLQRMWASQHGVGGNDEDIYEMVPDMTDNLFDTDDDITTVSDDNDSNEKQQEEALELYKQKCERLTQWTNLLSKRLLDKTQKRRHEKDLKRKYHKMILKLEQEHRLEREQLQQNLHAMEQQLQLQDRPPMQQTIPSAPTPVAHKLVQWQNSDDENVDSSMMMTPRSPRRWSALCFGSKELERAVDLFWHTSSSSSSSNFSMASTIIQENRCFPAMLAAIIASRK